MIRKQIYHLRYHLFLTVLGLAYSGIISAQYINGRYITEIFNNYTETSNVQFSTNVPRPNPGGGFYETITGLPLNVREYQFTNINLAMDILQPEGDTISKRPLVIICFGGGFVTGNRQYWSMRLIAEELVKRGFVTALIDYRLGMNIFNQELAKRAVYRGLQDGRSAVRFFRADADGSNTYRIDPDHIYIGGHSAGAFVGLHNAYLDKEFERPPSTYEWTQSCGFLGLSTCICPDQGCIDCVGNNQQYSGHANAVFSLAGAVGSTQYIETNEDRKAVLFHSQDDGTVPYDSGSPFQDLLWLVIGGDLPDVYGSLPISQRSDTLQLPYEFYSYNDRGHGVHEQTGSSLYPDIIPGISNWFFEELLKPASPKLIGNKYVCSENLTQTYKATSKGAYFYEWTVVGGEIQAYGITDSIVSVIWHPDATEHMISVKPYSVQWAEGDLQLMEVIIQTDGVIIWQGENHDWMDAANWDLKSVPQVCHHVIIDHTNSSIDPIIYENLDISIKSLENNGQLEVLIQNNSSLNILGNAGNQ